MARSDARVKRAGPDPTRSFLSELDSERMPHRSVDVVGDLVVGGASVTGDTPS